MVDNKETSGVKSVDLPLLKSVLPEDHLNHAILRACERLELAFNDRKKNYLVKIEVLMSVLESLLTDCLARVSPEITSLLFYYLLKHTLLLVFHGDWGHHKAVKLHMQSLFKQFKVRAEKKKLPQVIHEIEYLLELTERDPWGNSALVKILGDGKETDDELLAFVKLEMGIFLNVRLVVLMYARCESRAMTLVEKCLHCVSTSANSEYFQSYSDEITQLRDLYLLLLNKAKSNSYVIGKLSNEVNKMGLEECLKFINRCQDEVLPFKILSKRSADVVVNMALASAIVKGDADEGILQELIKVWFDSFVDSQVLFRLLRHMVLNAASSRFIYLFGKTMIEKFKLTEKELCVEVYIRGLTLNVNEVERYKMNGDLDKAKEYEVQLSNGFLQLGEYLKEDGLLHRECVLAAFSINPSLSSLERIKALAENSGMFFVETNVKDKSYEKDSSVINRGELLLPHCYKSQTTSIEYCEQDPTPVSAKQMFDEPDPNDFKENERFCGGTSPFLILQRVRVPDTVCIDGTGKLNATVKNNSKQTQLKEPILDENQINGDSVLKEINHCDLALKIPNISLEDGDDRDRKHDKGKNFNNINVSGFDSRFLQCVQAYDAGAIGISQTLCDDLSTLVSNVKNQDLTWDLEWLELCRRCEAYIAQGKTYKSVNKVVAHEDEDYSPSREKQRSGMCHEDAGQVSDRVFNLAVATPKKASKRKRKRV